MNILELNISYKDKKHFHKEMITCLVEHYGKEHRLSIVYLQELHDITTHKMLANNLLWSCNTLYKAVMADKELIDKLGNIILKYIKK
jgi:hypothetical protein